VLALVAAWSSIALGPAAHAQTSPGVLVTVKPVFPAEVTVGEPLVPASLELASSEILPVLVTSITVDSDGLALSPAALGTGPTCPGVPFGVVPDPSGRSVFIPSAPIVLPPFANVFPATCTIRFTFFSGVAARPAVRTVATLRVFSGLSADQVVSGESTTAVRPAPVTVTVLSGPVPVALGGTVEATAAVIPQFGDQPVPPLVPPPTGSVTFSLYGPDDPACRGRPARVSPDQPLALVLLAHSAALRPSFAGTYRWVGRYSGDAAHAPTSSACSADTSVTGPGVTSTVATTTSTVLATVPTAPAVVPAPVEGPPAQPIRPAPSRSVTPGSLAVYEPSAHATEIVSLQVSVFALLALVGAVPTPGGSGPAPDADSREAGELVATEVESADEGLASTQAVASGAGDRSWTWRSPGTHRLDRISRRGPLVLAPRSPLLARILNDAGYLRAMFGAASMLLPAAGVVLGVLAVADVGGQALPPRLGLAVGLAALGVFDALAGLVGVAVFVVGVVAAGGLVSADAVRTLLGLATLWFAAPLIAGTARPLRRPPTLTFDQHLDRTADVVIASLIGAWAVQKIVQGLPGLAGVELPIASQAGVIALMVLGALVVRMVVETVTAHSYPQRLAAVQPADLPAPGTGQRLAANGLVLAVFVFVAVSYLGLCWQLYVGAALFVTPKLLGLVADRLPSASRLQVLTPRGVVQIVLLLLIGVLLGTHVLANLADGRQLIRDSFVVLSVPGFVVALLELLAGEAPERERRWFYQLLGVPVLTLGVLLALGIVA
jgi:hypothetical protein